MNLTSHSPNLVIVRYLLSSEVWLKWFSLYECLKHDSCSGSLALWYCSSIISVWYGGRKIFPMRSKIRKPNAGDGIVLFLTWFMHHGLFFCQEFILVFNINLANQVILQNPKSSVRTSTSRLMFDRNGFLVQIFKRMMLALWHYSSTSIWCSARNVS